MKAGRRAAYRRAEYRRTLCRGIILFAAAAAAVLMLLLAGTHRISAESKSPAGDTGKYYMSYEIMPGDTLWTIAETYRDPGNESIASYMDDVRCINSLSSDSLMAGSRICIPYYPEAC